MKYGLQLRVPPLQQKKAHTKPPLPTLSAFNDDDDDDVEREIDRQAIKNKTLKDIGEQHKKAVEEDPSVFDYDGVYDEMKEKAVRPAAHDRQERKAKYIPLLMQKTKEREKEHDIIYEKKIAKERSKDDHLYADKAKYVTSAYKRKLAETAKWKEEERLRQLLEEKEDVTKKGDLSDFYFNLSKNVAFGAQEKDSRKQKQPIEEVRPQTSAYVPRQETHEDESKNQASFQRQAELHLEKSESPKQRHEPVTGEVTGISNLEDASESVAPKVASSFKQGDATEPVTIQPDHHKRQQDAVAAAKERFLARKKAKEGY